MNSPTITMDRTAAVAKLEQYEEAARRNPRARTDTDRRIADGYKVLAKGGRLVDVGEAIKAGGLNLAGIPKLAIARAHVEACDWRPVWNGWRNADGKRVVVTDGGGAYSWGGRNRRVTDDRVRWPVPAGTFEAAKVQCGRDFRALTPHVPLPHRPRHNLANYFLLWEASWHSLPTDPYLLRPVGGSLMEIVAEWDLTPLELAAVRAATPRA